MSQVKLSLSERINREMSFQDQLWLTLSLSSPAILAQLSTICMQYIDAAMVGSLGANASAAIGLMAAPLWLFSGICISSVAGYSVQVAHFLGALENQQARVVVRQAYVVLVGFASVVAAIACSLSSWLPHFLGGAPEIAADASTYLLIFMLGMPFAALNFVSSAMLRCSGNMLLPSMLNILMCILDVIFNFFLIFPTRSLDLPVLGSCSIYGAGLGVPGAALGTVLATMITGGCLTYALCFKSRSLSLTQERGSFKPTWQILKKALMISLPITAQQFMISSAQIVSTIIVAPLGTVAIAAHSIAITVEAICYMPGIGISDASTTLVGQSIGARRYDLTFKFAKICLGFGAVIMGGMGALMYFMSPWVMSLMTPDVKVQELAVNALRIEAFAEPFFALSIVGYGICVGAGSSLIPSLINLGSMWIIRLTMAFFLAQYFGLAGVWIAMAIELTLRGCMFLGYLKWGKWIQNFQPQSKTAS